MTLLFLLFTTLISACSLVMVRALLIEALKFDLKLDFLNLLITLISLSYTVFFKLNLSKNLDLLFVI